MSADETSSASRPAHLALWTVVLTGAALRLWRCTSGAFEGDEPFTLLARVMILDRGVPVLPSGLLYPYGGIDLYVGALGTAIGDLSVFWNRLPNALLGALAPLVFARTLRRHAGLWPAVVGAAVIAWHPGHVEWSAHVKVYGAQVLFVTLAVDRWLAWILDEAPRSLGWFVLWFALATSCHPNMGFMLPAFLGLPLFARGPRACLQSGPLLVGGFAVALAVGWIVLLRHVDPTLQAQMVDQGSETSLRTLLKKAWYGLRSHGWHSTWHAVPFVAMVLGTALAWMTPRGRAAGSTHLATLGLVGWLTTWLALALLSKHKAAMYLLPALPWMALALGGAAGALLQADAPRRRRHVTLAALGTVAVLHGLHTLDVWRDVLERHPRPRHYDLLREESVTGELSLGGGPLPVLLSDFRLDDHMVYGRDFGPATHIVDGRRVDRYLGNPLLSTTEAVRRELRGRPGAWYFVTDKELRTGRVSADLHAWLQQSLRRVSDDPPGLRVYRTR